MDVVCLYDENGFSGLEWAYAGHDVYCYDILHESERVEHLGLGRVFYIPWDARDQVQNQAIIDRHRGKTLITMCYPPCTDLAVSGAAWFKSKLAANPNYREEAMALVYTARDIAEEIGVPYFIENPVSVISSEWRTPDVLFHPYEFGGYLPEGDEHPVWPYYIMARDAYTKKTCFWVGCGFEMPERKPVPFERVGGRSKQDRMLGGKSAKTKNIRSFSPRGAHRAIFEKYPGRSFRIDLDDL